MPCSRQEAWRVTCAQHVERSQPETQEKQYAVLREKCITKKDEEPKKAVHTNGKRHTTCGLDGWKRAPQRHVVGCLAFARRSKANTNFAFFALGEELEACAAALMAFDCKLEVRLNNMWLKTGVEQMLSWIEKRKQPTFRSEHTSVWKAIWERLVQIPTGHVTMSQFILDGQTWKQ